MNPTRDDTPIYHHNLGRIGLERLFNSQIYIIPTPYILLIFVSVPILLLLDAACYVGTNRLGIK